MTIPKLVTKYDRLTMSAFGPRKGRLDEAKLRGQFAYWHYDRGIPLEVIDEMIELFVARTDSSTTEELQSRFTSRRTRHRLHQAALRHLRDRQTLEPLYRADNRRFDAQSGAEGAWRQSLRDLRPAPRGRFDDGAGQ